MVVSSNPAVNFEGGVNYGSMSNRILSLFFSFSLLWILSLRPNSLHRSTWNNIVSELSEPISTEYGLYILHPVVSIQYDLDGIPESVLPRTVLRLGQGNVGRHSIVVVAIRANNLLLFLAQTLELFPSSIRLLTWWIFGGVYSECFELRCYVMHVNQSSFLNIVFETNRCRDEP